VGASWGSLHPWRPCVRHKIPAEGDAGRPASPAEGTSTGGPPRSPPKDPAGEPPRPPAAQPRWPLWEQSGGPLGAWPSPKVPTGEAVPAPCDPTKVLAKGSAPVPCRPAKVTAGGSCLGAPPPVESGEKSPRENTEMQGFPPRGAPRYQLGGRGPVPCVIKGHLGSCRRACCFPKAVAGGANPVPCQLPKVPAAGPRCGNQGVRMDLRSFQCVV
jgi:hypothetical protein